MFKPRGPAHTTTHGQVIRVPSVRACTSMHRSNAAGSAAPNMARAPCPAPTRACNTAMQRAAPHVRPPHAHICTRACPAAMQRAALHQQGVCAAASKSPYVHPAQRRTSRCWAWCRTLPGAARRAAQQRGRDLAQVPARHLRRQAKHAPVTPTARGGGRAAKRAPPAASSRSDMHVTGARSQPAPSPPRTRPACAHNVASARALPQQCTRRAARATRAWLSRRGSHGTTHAHVHAAPTTTCGATPSHTHAGHRMRQLTRAQGRGSWPRAN